MTNFIDKIISYVNPKKGFERKKFREMSSSSFYGSSSSRRQLKEWTSSVLDADSDLGTADLDTLRYRSRDLYRNNPLATGAIKTVTSHAVGNGLKLQSRLDNTVLNLSSDKVKSIQDQIEREWKIFSQSKECEISRTMNFNEMQKILFTSAFLNGDVFVLMTDTNKLDNPYKLTLQMIEADRVRNPGYQPNSKELVNGVIKTKKGQVRGYVVANEHPGNRITQDTDVQKIAARSKNRINMIHLALKDRVGQSRGTPYLAPVIESLKMLSRYTEAEIMAAVVSSMFTVFVKTPDGDTTLSNMTASSAVGDGPTDSDDIALGSGAIVSLAEGESVETANPGRPNAGFDPFVQAILRQIGVALEIPFELLIKHFTSSYAAARAALLEANTFFKQQRRWFADNLCDIVYEEFLKEAILTGKVKAPGFFRSLEIRKAYLQAEWIGAAAGQIDPLKEVQAAEKRLELNLTSRAREVAELNGSDFETEFEQIKKEKEIIGNGDMGNSSPVRGEDERSSKRQPQTDE